MMPLVTERSYLLLQGDKVQMCASSLFGIWVLSCEMFWTWVARPRASNGFVSFEARPTIAKVVVRFEVLSDQSSISLIVG